MATDATYLGRSRISRYFFPGRGVQVTELGQVTGYEKTEAVRAFPPGKAGSKKGKGLGRRTQSGAISLTYSGRAAYASYIKDAATSSRQSSGAQISKEPDGLYWRIRTESKKKGIFES
jgi:hypothetical protein